MVRLKGVVANVVDITREGDRDDIYLALEHVESWTGRFTAAKGGGDVDGQVKRFRTGDVLFGKLRPYLAKVVGPGRSGVCAGEFLVLRPRRAKLVPKYLEQLMRSKPVIVAINASTFGAKMPRADWRFIGNMRFRIPPLAEQVAIAGFLEHADRRIRRYIRAKERLIELLEEQKQAIIHQAVTGQIDVRTGQPYPAYKDSGVEWLGEVPEHWEVGRLKHLTHGVTVGIVVTPSKYYVDQGVPCLRSLNVSGGVVDMTNLVFISESANEFHRKSKIFRGDVVVVRTGQAGTAAVVPEELDGANCIDLLIVRRSDQLLSRFVYYYLNSRTAMSQAKAQSVGAIQAHYNTSTLAQLVCPRVSRDEQACIVSFLDKALRRTDRVVTLTKRAVTRLEEFRTRLIADVVTGKLDVREAAASIPGIGGLDANQKGPDSDMDASVGLETTDLTLPDTHP